MREFVLSVFLVATLVLAGCVAAPVQTASVQAPLEPATAPTFLANATPAGDALTAPTFTLMGAVAKGGPAYGAGEPSIAAGPDGAIYVSFPGCDQNPIWLEDAVLGGRTPTAKCDTGVVYGSLDHGKTWKRFNADGKGTLAKDAPPANGDADIAVDANGTIYVSNLGNGIETQRSDDGGHTWNYTGNIVPKSDRSVDRNWLAAAGPGHVIHNWMGGPKNAERDVGIITTWDGGRTWSNVTYLGKDIGWEGSVQFAPDGETAYIPFTLNQGGGTVLGGDYELVVGKTTDGGATWSISSTNTTLHTSQTSFHFSGMLLAPSLAVTGDGHVVYVYSEEANDPAGASTTGAIVKLIASGDNGTTWSKPYVVSHAPSAIFPWVTGGAGNRIAVTYFADNLPGNPDRVGGVWDLHAAVIDGAGTDAVKVVDSLVDAGVHYGGICAGGGSCLITGGDRELLDYFENCALPDGRIAIVYPADPHTNGKMTEIRVAVQKSGSLLFAPANP